MARKQAVRSSSRLLPGVRTSERSSKPKYVTGRQKKRKFNISAKEYPYMAEVRRNRYMRTAGRGTSKPINEEGFMRMIGAKTKNKKYESRMKGAVRKRNARMKRSKKKSKDTQKDYGDAMFNMFADESEKEAYAPERQKEEQRKAKRRAYAKKYYQMKKRLNSVLLAG